jgi:hypothetical protein
VKQKLSNVALYVIAPVYLVGAVIAPLVWDLAKEWWKS